MADNFATHAESLNSPASRHQVITPDDGADLSPVPRALFCNASGTAVIRDAAGTDVAYDLMAGQILPLRARRVLATGTTAGLIGWE
ncbi:spike base protein, RCAP_Rcc01079 family [Pseudoroseicyclus sp. H15]